MPLNQTSAGLPELPHRGLEAANDFCRVALVDVDDFVVSRLARGTDWASSLIRDVARILEEERALIAPDSTAHHLEPDEWIVVLRDTDPRRLNAVSNELANRLCRRIGEQTPCTVTVSLGAVRRGEHRTERSTAEAVAANQRKLMLGGNRVILAEQSAGAESERPSPERIEQELSRLIRAGDKAGALELLKTWFAQSATLEGVTPEVLRSWLAAVILFSLNIVDNQRLADGSMDWVEIFGRTPFDELIAIGPIHEQSYLGLWLEQTLGRIIEKQKEPRQSGRHILALVESYLSEHYAEDLSLAKVSKALYVSPFYISHLFHRELNTTFLKYLTAIRVAKARHLLLETDTSVGAIAAQLGYATPKSFRSVFKRTVGVTPIEYRRANVAG